MLTKAMKIRIGTAAAVLAAALTSCVSNEVAQPVSEDIPITYSVLQKSMATRAAVTGTTYPQDVPFGSFAYYLPAGKTWRDDKKDAQIYIDNDEVTYDEQGTNSFASNSWHSDIVHYWPKAGSLTFFSYSPYEKLKDVISCTKENGLVINSWTAGMVPGDADDSETSDLMIAKSENQTGNTSSVAGYQAGVPTAFQHILCQIEVRAKMDDADTDKEIVIYSVSLNNLWSKAVFSNEQWNNHSEKIDTVKKDLGTSGVLLDKDVTKFETVFPSMLMIPQSRLSVSGAEGREDPGITIRYAYKEASESSYRITKVTKTFLDIDGRNQSWIQGRKYILTIAFSTKDAYIEFDTTVEGWKDGTGVDIIVGN